MVMTAVAVEPAKTVQFAFCVSRALRGGRGKEEPPLFVLLLGVLGGATGRVWP